MATTKLKIRNDLAKKAGGETAIYVQYCYDGKIKLFNTGKKIAPEYWDAKAEQVKRSYKGYTTLNAAINAKKKEVDGIVDEAHFRKIEPTLEYVQAAFEKLTKPATPETNKDFYKLYEQYMEDCKPKKAYNTIKQHRTAYNHVKQFEEAAKYRVTLERITMDFYNRFTSFLIEHKNISPNSIGDAIKNLKIFLGDLTERGINTNLTFRKKEFRKPSAPVEIITLTQAELEKLLALDLSKNSRLDKVRDLFCFGCTTGLRFSDIENLKPDNVKSDSIQLTTVKTRDRLYIPLNHYSRTILAKYNNQLPEVISNQKMNDYLKELAQIAGLNEPVQQVKYVGAKRVDTKTPKHELVTTHTARRTFITLSLEKGMRPEEIMKITGHKNIKTMMRYVNITADVTRHSMVRAWGDGPAKAQVN